MCDSFAFREITFLSFFSCFHLDNRMQNVHTVVEIHACSAMHNVLLQLTSVTANSWFCQACCATVAKDSFLSVPGDSGMGLCAVFDFVWISFCLKPHILLSDFSRIACIFLMPHGKASHSGD